MMDFGAGIDQLRYAWWMILITSGPALGVALAAGLAIGVVQAATSINESTLSFVPKLALVLITLALTADYLVTHVKDHFMIVFDTIATLR